MAGSAAFAAGSSAPFRKRSSFAFLFMRQQPSQEVKPGYRKEDVRQYDPNKPVPGGYHPHSASHYHHHQVDPLEAKRFLPVFYNPSEPPRILVHEYSDEEASTAFYCKDEQHRLSVHSTSSLSTERPLRIAENQSSNVSNSELNRRQPKKSKKDKLRRTSSWRAQLDEPSALTRAIPYLTPPSVAYICCFINVVLPGFGTLTAASISYLKPLMARSEFSPKKTFLWNFLAFGLQLLFAPILFGWIYGILWGMEAIERAKLLEISKLADKHEQLEADAAEAAEEAMQNQGNERHSVHHHQDDDNQRQDERDLSARQLFADQSNTSLKVVTQMPTLEIAEHSDQHAVLPEDSKPEDNPVTVRREQTQQPRAASDENV